MGQVWSSVAGLGGCRYTTGASGTEHVVLHAQRIRYQTNVDMGKLMAAVALSRITANASKYDWE